MLFSRSVVSNSSWPHGLQHARFPCPSLSPRVCSNSCPLSRWCHPTISSSVVPVFSCPQSFPASRSFSTSWRFPSDGQSIGASASALSTNVRLSNIGGKLAKWTTFFFTRVFSPLGFYFKSDALCLALFFSEDFPLCGGMTSQICFKILSKSYSKCWL